MRIPEEDGLNLREKAISYDTETGLAFLDTSFCFGWFMDGYSTQSTYDVPVEDNPFDEIVRRHSIPSYGKHFANSEIFGHETNIYSQSYDIDSDYRSFVEQICKFGDDYNYDFDFPQNSFLNITSLILS